MDIKVFCNGVKTQVYDGNELEVDIEEVDRVALLNSLVTHFTLKEILGNFDKGAIIEELEKIK